MKHRVFERMDVFSTKYGHESGLFVENERFLPNMGMTAGLGEGRYSTWGPSIMSLFKEEGAVRGGLGWGQYGQV